MYISDLKKPFIPGSVLILQQLCINKQYQRRMLMYVAFILKDFNVTD